MRASYPVEVDNGKGREDPRLRADAAIHQRHQAPFPIR
jgi:hypothetical protein